MFLNSVRYCDCAHIFWKKYSMGRGGTHSPRDVFKITNPNWCKFMAMKISGKYLGLGGFPSPSTCIFSKKEVRNRNISPSSKTYYIFIKIGWKLGENDQNEIFKKAAHWTSRLPDSVLTLCFSVSCSCVGIITCFSKHLGKRRKRAESME